MDEAVVREVLASISRAVGGRRRLFAAAAAAVAMLAALHVLTTARPAEVRVWAAARDLAGGAPLTGRDVRLVALPMAAVPDGALRAGTRVAGRLLAAPVRRGEPLTDVRILTPALLSALGGDRVAVPVRVADGAAAVALVHAGDLVDVLAAGDADLGTAPSRVAAAVRVLATPARDPGGEAIVVVAASRAQAGALARAQTAARLSLVLRR